MYKQLSIVALGVLLAGCGSDDTDSESELAGCGSLPHGELMERERFEAPSVQFPAECQSEIQQRSCNDGNLDEWTGSYSFTTCEQLTGSPEDLPLWTIDQLSYQGGFRLSSARFGESEHPTLSYSPGVIAYNSDRNSLYVVSHDYEQSIAEFSVPEVVNSQDMNDFNIGEEVLQEFAPFYGTDRVDTGIEDYFRITGMSLVEGQLLINYINWYDAGGNETDTSVRLMMPDSLAESDMFGPYQLEGKAHAAGWISEIPVEWQAELGGTHITGHAHGSIRSRLSVGPSAFVWSPASSILAQTEGSVETQVALDFPLSNILYDKTHYNEADFNLSAVLANEDGHNDLWTAISGASYGFIIPGTDSYLTVGFSGGNESGVGYKITQDNGHLCGGYCTYAADDNYNYYWLWRVSDLVKVRNGELEPYEIRPYDYGKLDTPPSTARVFGGAYDEVTQTLYLALKNGDTVSTYSRPPLFLVYQVGSSDL